MQSILLAAIATTLLSTTAFALPEYPFGQQQGQIQGQLQHQRQSQSLSNRNTSTNINAINTGTNTPWWGYGGGIAIAPGNAVGNGVCSSTASFAAGFIGSISFGFPITDHSCNVRANYQTFKLPAAVKRKLMCEDKYMNAAFTAAGYSDCANVHVAQ